MEFKNKIEEHRYNTAQKKIKKIRNFYNHLQIFVVVMLVLALFSNTIVGFFENRIANNSSLDWVKANIWVNALLWFVGVVIHGLFTFKDSLNFVDKWEKNKVDEFMKENE